MQDEIDSVAREPARHRTTTICRACHVSCSLVVEMEGDRPVKIYGDKNNPISHGFTCIKGRELHRYVDAPSRLLQSQRREADGTFRPIATDQATREIAEKLTAIIARHGPRAVAGYTGSFAYFAPLADAFLKTFLEGIGSPLHFFPQQIDQPGKPMALALHGAWLAGVQRSTEDVEVTLLFGSNPLISGGGPFGLSAAHNLHEAKQAGRKLIVCDPRRTETAVHADIFLQPRPGEDATILAGLIRIILAEGLEDRAFLAAEADGLDALRAAVEPYTPDVVATRADIAAADLIAAARLYASARKAVVFCGTGPNMSGASTLTEYLARVLQTVCGHWPRAGEPMANPGVLVNFPDPVAATPGPTPAWGFGQTMRVHGLTETAAGLPTSVLPDEILTPGEGQVRALIVVGGNPLVAFPDQIKTHAAFSSLELLVCIDPHLSQTARLAHYVIAPTLALETPSVCAFWEQGGAAGTIYGFNTPYQQYTPALLDPPAGSDVIDDWKFLFLLARHMGVQLRLRLGSILDPVRSTETAIPLDMESMPSTDEMLATWFTHSPVPYERVVREARDGKVFDVPPRFIAPKPAGWSGRFAIGNADMMAELHRRAAEDPAAKHAGFRYRMISRRLRDVFNSAWHEHAPLTRRWAYNPAFMHPADMLEAGLAAGDVIRIVSGIGETGGVVEPDATVKPGCISMAHSWGALPDEAEDPRRVGGCTSRLSSNVEDCDPFSFIPLMSAIPVNIVKA